MWQHKEKVFAFKFHVYSLKKNLKKTLKGL